jgi:hypothetical protein
MGDDARTDPALQAQLLATEHWSLLASRSTTQSEVLVRIGMLLTLMSAVLVSIALVGQATGFSGFFPVFADVLLALVAAVGVMTQIRVFNAGMDDLMYVLAMNRLRSAYVAIAPEVEPYLMASRHDDEEGMRHTYYFLGRRSVSQFLGSSMLFTSVVNAALVGVLVGAVLFTTGIPVDPCVGIGGAAAALYAVASVLVANRVFTSMWRRYRPLDASE